MGASGVYSYFPLRFIACPLLLLPFPTRRSSDLARLAAAAVAGFSALARDFALLRRVPCREAARNREQGRSEEHTSELQSRFDLVCRLPLERKNRRLSRCFSAARRQTRLVSLCTK